MKTAARRVALSAFMATTTVLTAPTLAFAADDVPNPKPVAPPGVQGKVDQLLGFLMYFGLAAVVGGFILAGIAMAIGKEHGRGGREGMDKLWYVAGGAVVIGSASSLAGWLL
jgi:Spy/CpxP family protein refolding chaperone